MQSAKSSVVSDTPSCIRFMRSTDRKPPVGAVQSVEDVLLRPVHWTAALPATLRQIGVADLLSPIRSRLRVLRHGAHDGASRQRGKGVSLARSIRQLARWAASFLLECLPSRAVAELDAVGLSLRGVDDSTVPADVGVLRQAWHLTHAVWPELSSSVGHLVRCVHLLKAPSPRWIAASAGRTCLFPCSSPYQTTGLTRGSSG